jgi:ABC-type spermidine/putrescine transport system permease subunit II
LNRRHLPRRIGALVFRFAAHLFGLTVVAYLLVPLVLAFLVSFYPGRAIGLPTFSTGVTVQWYVEFFNDERWVAGLRNSLYVGLISTAISLVCGLSLALAVTRYRLRGDVILATALMLPIFVPAVIIGMQSLSFSYLIGLWGTHLSIGIAHALWATPLVYMVLISGLRRVSIELEEAAASLGANPWAAFRAVVWPLIVPSVMAAGVIGYIISLNEFIMALFLGTPNTETLPKMIWPQIRHSVSPVVAAASSVLLVITVLALAITARAVNLSRAIQGR